MDKLSFFLVAGRNTHRLELNVKLLVVIGVLVFTAIGAGGYFAFRTAQKTVDLRALESLQTENRLLRSRITNLVNDIEEIKVALDNVYKTDQSIRLTYGIELINSELKSPGIGGKGDLLSSFGHKEIERASREIDRLLATARFERASYEEINKHLKTKFAILAHTPSIMPVNGILTSGFGPRIDPFTGRLRFHEGQDIAGPPGTPIVAPADGIISSVKRRGGYGLTIDIDHGYGIKTRYAHCMSARVNPGMRVKRGDVIGLVGASGRATGPHLHYEVHIAGKKVNPLNYIIGQKIIVD